jgi:hypothetical protein
MTVIERHCCSYGQAFYWPGKNANEFLALGCLNHVRGLRKMDNPVLFIELTWNNLRHFFKQDWCADLTGMRLIFLPDKGLEVVADYLVSIGWAMSSTSDFMVSIVSAYNTENIVADITSAFYRNTVFRIPERNKMKMKEFLIFKMLYLEMAPKDVASTCLLNVKKVYAYKRVIEKKINTRILKGGEVVINAPSCPLLLNKY